ncbi:MAG TPA: anthranilate phosphoribosyltransferase [Thermoplasmata archaeon]|nr:anthranilate phosphoribosyltransferase [Thermoplasmata archaeon]
MTREILDRLLARQELRRSEVRALVGRLVDASTDDLERAALLVALRAKGETPREVQAFAQELRRRSVAFPGPRTDGAVDLCGSGGARTPSFNIGTVSAFVVRAAGVPVAKHGNRSARGSARGYAGSSDLLEALGLPVTTSADFARESYRRFGLAFLHAPLYHTATSAVMPVRRGLGIPTVFNQLGPLTNPANVPFQVVGCPEPLVAERVARILPKLGVRAGIAVAGDDGTDEFTPRGTSQCYVWARGRLARRAIRAADLLAAEDRTGGWGPLPAPAAAEEATRLLAGGGGARRGSILLTSGAALWISGRTADLPTGVRQAQGALDDGRAEALLRAMQQLARERNWSSGN